jgi:hypothetical protein
LDLLFGRFRSRLRMGHFRLAHPGWSTTRGHRGQLNAGAVSASL